MLVGKLKPLKMLQPITINKLLNSLDWLLFLILCILAFLICWPMLLEYESKQTSLSQSKGAILERPTITICFDVRKFEDFEDEITDSCGGGNSNR